MGYEVDIKLKNVMFKNEHTQTIISILKKYNLEVLKPKSDWCRFNNDLDSIVDILEDMNFDVELVGEYCHIKEFNSSNLGRHEEILRLMAPYLEDCEVKFIGEDDNAWKFKIEDGIALDSVHREEF